MRLEGRCERGDLRPPGRHTFLSCKELSQSLHRQVNKSAADLWRPWSPSLSGRCKMGIFRLLSLYPSNVLRNFSSAAAQREEEESEVSSGAGRWTDSSSFLPLHIRELPGMMSAKFSNFFTPLPLVHIWI